MTISPGSKVGLAGAFDEIGDRHRARRDRLAFEPRNLDHAVHGDDRRRAVGGRRGVDDIAGERRLLADLVVGEPHRAMGHRREMGAQRFVIEELLVDDVGAEPHLAVRDRIARQLLDAAQVDQRGQMHIASPALARPGQDVGRAGHQSGAGRRRCPKAQRLGEARRHQIVVIGQHAASKRRDGASTMEHEPRNQRGTLPLPWEPPRNTINEHSRRPGRPKAEPGSTRISAVISICCEHSRPRLKAGATTAFFDDFVIQSLFCRGLPGQGVRQNTWQCHCVAGSSVGTSSYSAAIRCAAACSFFTTTLIASSTRSLA